MDGVASARDRAAWIERLVRAAPLASIFLWLFVVYAWEARGHVTPWLFGDELEMAQLSRAISETGQPARRGEPYGDLPSLYAYLLAPWWWIDSVGTAYAAIKYFGVAVMASAVFPAYFLARMLVDRPAALFAAAATGAIPSLVYATYLLEEPLAYPWAVLCFWLIVRALTLRTRWSFALAIAASVIAPLVRDQLALVLAAFAGAGLVLFWQSERMRRWRSSWSRWDWAGFAVLGAGTLILLSALLGSASYTWLVASGYYRGRMIEYGLWAAGALAIGTGVLPAVAGLAALARPRAERVSRAMQAFVATSLSALVFFGLYAATKAAYISTVFATRTVERNLIYVAPLLFVGTAVWLERPRLRLAALGAAAGFVAYIVTTSPYRMDIHLDADAVGLSALQWANRNIALTPEAAKWSLVGVLVTLVALLLVRDRFAERRRLALGIGASLAVAVVGWNLSGQLAASAATNSFARDFLRNFPSPPTWLDEATSGEDALFLGQRIDDPNGILLIEFWNRSLRDVWSLDGTAPGPGYTVTPDLSGARGVLAPDPVGRSYVVAGEGIDVDGPLVFQPTIRTVTTTDRFGFDLPEPIVQLRPAPWRVVGLEHPLRLRSAPVGIFPDGWTGEFSAFSQFQTKGNRAGWAVITVSRAGWRGPDKPGNVVVRVGQLVQGEDKQPAMGRVSAEVRWTVHSGTKRTFVLRTPPPPIRMEVRVAPTFTPRDYGFSDPRQLGAQVSYAFSLTRPRRDS